MRVLFRVRNPFGALRQILGPPKSAEPNQSLRLDNEVLALFGFTRIAELRLTSQATCGLGEAKAPLNYIPQSVLFRSAFSALFSCIRSQ